MQADTTTQKELLKLMAYSPDMKANVTPHGKEGGIPLSSATTNQQ